MKVVDFGLAKVTAQEAAKWIESDRPTRTDLKTDSGVVMGDGDLHVARAGAWTTSGRAVAEMKLENEKDRHEFS